MERDKAYNKLLSKMLTIENIGEVLYRTLVFKAEDINQKSIYERLAKNEQETARNIENEILALDKNHPILVNSAILNLAKLICGILTTRQLTWILKSALKRKIYSKWHNRYKDRNQNFWRLLLNHENLQHELLSPLSNH